MDNCKYAQPFEEPFSLKTVAEEADRCLLCLDAPCSAACPAGTDPGKFIRSVRFLNYVGAAETIRTNNPLGSICARVCPTERYCQKGCSRSGIDRPIDIGKIQQFVTDYEEARGFKFLPKGKRNGKKVAIVGAGPAGLTAAATLEKLGYAAEVFDKNPEAGGYLRYGIPEYRLPNRVVDEEIGRIEGLGVKIHHNVRIGQKELDGLKGRFDAVVLAIGASQGKVLPMFKGAKNVVTAVDFLARTKTKAGKIALPKSALVIGGGDVAMDTVTTLKLLGVEEVTDVVYETFAEFKASEKELRGAQKLGVSILDGYMPTKFEGGVVEFTHRYKESRLSVKADLIVLAVGQTSDLGDITDIRLSKGEGADSGNVFVAGDIAHGDKTVVYGVRTGKEVAYRIDAYLEGK
ncbi:MAG: FAD-dependent oxidoreductase [Bacilli bacterium]|jgi:dihydropyrimidine dehydrogenase (NAD+) subunit PreT|nr:FAD-dependent oxidoreductase [Bacilli bacterium]